MGAAAEGTVSAQSLKHQGRIPVPQCKGKINIFVHLTLFLGRLSGHCLGHSLLFTPKDEPEDMERDKSKLNLNYF